MPGNLSFVTQEGEKRGMRTRLGGGGGGEGGGVGGVDLHPNWSLVERNRKDYFPL